MVLVLISIIINIVIYDSASEGSKICMIIRCKLYFKLCSSVLWEIGMILGVIAFKRQNAI